MSEIMFTEKQKGLIRMLKKDEFKRINILYGSVRSGKTWITLILFALWVSTMPADGSYLMVAKTITSLRRNCLDLLQELIGKNNFDYSISAKTGVLFGRKIYLEGANDARSESKIRGMTLQGAYVDEITLIEKDFFAMLLSRLSMKGAKLFGSTNPDNPFHWLKAEYLDRQEQLDLFQQKFVIEDNTFLDEEYVESLKSEYTGIFYSRFILGEFTAAEGLIYDMFDPSIHVVDSSDLDYEGDFYVSSDYGIQNANVFLLWRKEKGRNRHVILRECYYSGREEHKQKTVSELVAMLKEMLEGIKPEKIIVDPSAAALIVELRKQGFSVQKADNDVLDGIADVATMLKKEQIAIDKSCKNTINEFGVYCWDDKAAQHGIDQPIKANDHAMDAVRYYVKTRKLVKKDWNDATTTYISRWH